MPLVSKHNRTLENKIPRSRRSGSNESSSFRFSRLEVISNDSLITPDTDKKMLSSNKMVSENQKILIPISQNRSNSGTPASKHTGSRGVSHNRLDEARRRKVELKKKALHLRCFVQENKENLDKIRYQDIRELKDMIRLLESGDN